MIKKIGIVFFIVYIIFSAGVSADEFAPVGTAVAQFLEIGLGARSTGMGEAVTSVINDASAVFWNPAGLADVSHLNLYSAYNSWPAGISIGGLSVAMSLGNLGTFGVNTVYLMTDDMEITTVDFPDGTGEYFNISNYSLGLTYSRYLTDKVSIGVTTKLVCEGYWDYSYTSWAIDLGTLYRTGFHGLNIAMSILNFGPEVKFNGDYIDYSDPLSYNAQPEPVPKSFEKYSLPINFRFGTSIDLIDTDHHRLISAFDMVHPNNNLEQYNLGFEYSMNSMFFLRTGYRFNTDEGGLSFGGGINIIMGENLNLRTDYSYADMGILKSIHRFSIGFNF